MLTKKNTSNPVATFNKFGSQYLWPRLWILILGIIMIFLCLCIAGMEVGHVLVDLYRSTAFGGFIIFIPLLLCAIFVIVTAFKPRLILLRITMILCVIMIVLCLALIAYAILVLYDPTRCFFLNCNYANVTYQPNSTYNATVTGWPLVISWPSYFQNNMTAIRFFQAAQLLCAALFILCCSLYILTYIIYRRIKLHHQTTYHPEQQTFIVPQSSTTTLTKHVLPHGSVTTYMIDCQHDVPVRYDHSPISVVHMPNGTRRNKKKTVVRPRASSVSYDRLCTRCAREPRMVLTNNYERHNFFSHLCVNCNEELLNDRRKPAVVSSPSTRTWKF